jgi:hypothetical protein
VGTENDGDGVFAGFVMVVACFSLLCASIAFIVIALLSRR